MAADRQADTSMTLLERLQKNPADPQAWDLFVERYQPRIQSWCVNWGLQASDAEDVAQEVLVKLFAAMSKFQYDPARSFRAWLKTVTKHAWCDFLAARKRDPGRTAGPLDTIAGSADAQSDLERHLEDAFDAELLDLAMHRVKNRVKSATWQAFQLTVVEGLSGADAAQKLQIPVAHVFVERTACRRCFRRKLGS